jgi:hypothetical protein
MPDSPRCIGIAADHGVYASKDNLAGMLRDARYEVIDFGDSQPKPDDGDPDFVVPSPRWKRRGCAYCRQQGSIQAIQAVFTRAPGDDAPIAGMKVAEGGWFAARPPGTEDISKIHAESFQGTDHLRRILEEAQLVVNDTLGAAPYRS